MLPMPLFAPVENAKNNSNRNKIYDYQDHQYNVNMMVSDSPFIYDIDRKIKRVFNYFMQLNEFDLDSLDPEKRQEVFTAYIYAYTYLAATKLGYQTMEAAMAGNVTELTQQIKDGAEVSNLLKYAEPSMVQDKKFAELAEIAEALIVKFSEVGMTLPATELVENAIKEVLGKKEYTRLIGEGNHSETMGLNALRLILSFSANMENVSSTPEKYIELVRDIASYSVDLKNKQMKYRNALLNIEMRAIRAFVNGYNDGIELSDYNSWPEENKFKRK
jgi:hypothetical protein